MRERDPLSVVLGSVEAARNTRALFVLLASFAAGLLVAMAGLFGYGLRGLGAAGAPGPIYLRGTCAVYLALTEDTPS